MMLQRQAMNIAPRSFRPATDKSVAQCLDAPGGANSMVNRVALLSFVTLTFTWSWSLWLLSAMIHPQSSTAASVLSVAASFGPSLSAVAVVCFSAGRVELRCWLRRCLQWRARWRWMLLAFLLPLGVMSSLALGHLVHGGTLVSSLAQDHLLMAPAVFVGVFLAGGLLGDEFGWRRHALPALQKRYGWRIASLVVGAMWGVWHLPLFHLVGSTQSQTPMLIFMPMIVALSVLFAWFFNRTVHSAVPALVLHTAFNTWAFFTPTLPSGGGQRPSETVVGVFVLIALVLLFTADRAEA